MGSREFNMVQGFRHGRSANGLGAARGNIGRTLVGKRKPCGHNGCQEPHLKGSDYCFKHDDGKRPRTRAAD